MEKRDDLLNASGVEVGQRFVQEQKLRTADQRMGNENPLLFSTRKRSDPSIGETIRIDIVKYLLDGPALLLGPAANAELLCVEPQGNKVTCSHGQVGVEHDLLRNVPEGSATLVVSRAGDLNGSGLGALRAENDPEQRRFAHAVGPDEAGELSFTDFERHVVQDPPAGQGDADPVDLEYGQWAHRCSVDVPCSTAALMAATSAIIHDW